MENRLSGIREVKMPKLDGVSEMDYAISFVRKCFEEKGNISAMVIGIAGDNRYVVPFIHKSDEEKYKLAGIIKRFFKSKGVDQIQFMTEAWMVKQSSKMGVNTAIRPSQHPLKQEIVMINIFERTKCDSAILSIIRGNSKEVSLGEPKLSSQEGVDFVDRIWGDYFKGGENAKTL